MTMIELLVGLVVFSFAILPILNFTSTTTRSTYITGKHLMAGKLASSILDRLLSLPFQESFVEGKKLATGQAIKAMDDESLTKLLESQPLAEGLKVLQDDLEKSFRFFEYKVSLETDPPDSNPEKMFLISVMVTWRIEEGDERSRQGMILECVKYNENQ